MVAEMNLEIKVTEWWGKRESNHLNKKKNNKNSQMKTLPGNFKKTKCSNGNLIPCICIARLMVLACLVCSPVLVYRPV